MISRLMRMLRGPARPLSGAHRTPPTRVASGGPPPPDRERELLLYKFDSCPFCRRVMSTISDLGLDVPTADTRRDPNARRALLDATGRTQVPALLIDGYPLLESADISRWLQQYARR